MKPRIGRLGGLLVAPIAVMAFPILAALAFASPASATPLVTGYGPGVCTPVISVTPNPVVAGGTVTVTITGNCFNDPFTVTIGGVTLGTVTTNATGSGSGTFTVPATLTGTSASLTVADASGNSSAATVGLTGAATATTTTTVAGALPFTGTNVAAMGAVAAGVLGAGGLLVLSSRKRRRSNFS